MYTVDFFIDKFEKIPEDKWITNAFEENGRCCALGYCGWRVGNAINDEGTALISLLERFDNLTCIPDINDGNDNNYPQPTPKQRILAALYDIRAMQNKDAVRTDITKSLAVLPVEEKLDAIPVDVEVV